MQKSMMTTIDNNIDGITTTTAMRTLMPTVRPAPTTVGMKKEKQHIHIYNYYKNSIYVGASSKIQTLCRMTQVLLKLRFTALERLTGY